MAHARARTGSASHFLGCKPRCSTTPQTKVLIANGRYDLVTPYLSSRWFVDQLAIPHAVREAIRLKVYDGGHMMYLRAQSRDALAAEGRRSCRPLGPPGAAGLRTDCIIWSSAAISASAACDTGSIWRSTSAAASIVDSASRRGSRRNWPKAGPGAAGSAPCRCSFNSHGLRHHKVFAWLQVPSRMTMPSQAAARIAVGSSIGFAVPAEHAQFAPLRRRGASGAEMQHCPAPRLGRAAERPRQPRP